VVCPLIPGPEKEGVSDDLLDRHLTQALDEPGVTAIVAPRDYTAARYFYRLTHHGVRVPRDISLIAFDNSAHAQPVGITSVDFGFNHLGYSAFHLILRDIPVARTRAQAVPGKASVVRRSTVGIVR
jgi:DNA-binding LacI/PurR family transcriptional regulator